MNRRLLHTPEGVRDLYGTEYARKLQLEGKLHEIIASYEYQDIQTPTLEFFDVFSSNIGTTPSNELFKFYDQEGNTLVLRPDFTPSIARCAARYFREEESPMRFSYSGNTFSNTAGLQGKLKEVTQMGAELLGDASVEADGEMLRLVVDALKGAGLADFRITVGQVEYFKGLCEEAGLDEATETQLRSHICDKNYFAVQETLAEQNVAEPYRSMLLQLADMFDSGDSLADAGKKVKNIRSLEALQRLEKLQKVLETYGIAEYITFDLGLLSNYNYYTGMIFKAYTYGIGDAVVKGGRYDHLLRQFGKDAPAIGFAIVVDDLLEALHRQEAEDSSSGYLTFALAKGRLARKAMELMGQIGFVCEEMEDKNTRKLIFVNEELKLRFFLAKAPDVPTYVEYGAADIGVVGKDTLLEEGRNVNEVLDLGFGKCRMCVCGSADAKELLQHRERIRVATKYPEIAREYFFDRKHQTVDIIKLNGSVELGPLVALSDVIVDIVETGSTLHENGLQVLEEITPLSARMIVNPVSMQMEGQRIRNLVLELRKLLRQEA